MSIYKGTIKLSGGSSAEDSRIGDMETLATTEKTTLVGAINEISGNMPDISSVETNLLSLETELDNAKSSLSNAITSIGVLTDLTTDDKTNIVKAINEVKSSASNLKSVVAAAITGKGISASATDTAEQLATKIGQIQTATGNASTTDVLAGKTFSTSNGTGLTGTMTNKGAFNGQIVANPTSYKPYASSGAGYYSSIRVDLTMDPDCAEYIKKDCYISGLLGTYAGEYTYKTGTLSSLSSGMYISTGMKDIYLALLTFEPKNGGEVVFCPSTNLTGNRVNYPATYTSLPSDYLYISCMTDGRIRVIGDGLSYYSSIVNIRWIVFGKA